MKLRSISRAEKGEETMNEWRDISTAPRDGMLVLLSNNMGTWVGRYFDRFTSGYRPENPWQTMMLNHRHMPKHSSTKPTHWMPLPEPVAAEAVERQRDALRETLELLADGEGNKQEIAQQTLEALKEWGAT